MKTQNNFSKIKIPKYMKETQYVGYYVTEDGKCYREPGKCDKNRPLTEHGLIYLKPGYRGHPKSIHHQYECINISIRDENGKFLKQIKRSVHQLVAETFVPNPEGYNEVMHIDGNNRNNHYTNLKWGTHLENMSTVISPCTQKKPYTITNTKTGQIWKGYNITSWVRENYDLIIPKLKSKDSRIKTIAKHLSSVRCKNTKIWGFKVEY